MIIARLRALFGASRGCRMPTVEELRLFCQHHLKEMCPNRQPPHRCLSDEEMVAYGLHWQGVESLDRSRSPGSPRILVHVMVCAGCQALGEKLGQYIAAGLRALAAKKPSAT